MTLKDARQLQSEIRLAGYHCIVHLRRKPDDYVCRIFGKEPIDFHSRSAFRQHHAKRLMEQRQIHRAYEQMQDVRPAKSPIELMIDRACGLG